MGEDGAIIVDIGGPEAQSVVDSGIRLTEKGCGNRPASLSNVKNGVVALLTKRVLGGSTDRETASQLTNAIVA
jgi:hypothetical protein